MAKETPLTHDEILTALANLGHETGWVVSGGKIILWESSAPQPTEAELRGAL